MNYNNQILFWAHMLDESFVDEFTIKLPKNQNEKFKYCDVFTNDICLKLDTDQAMDMFLCKIWPTWEKYFINAVSKYIEVEGERKDVDDWDIWKISIEDLNGGYINCKSILFENIINDFECNYIGSLKDMIDLCIEKLTNTTYDISTLEQNGQLIYKGKYHTGGYYPDH